MTNTNGLSPLMQAAVGGEEQIDPTERIYGFDQYKAGDMVTEDDLEGMFEQTGNNPKDYPQLSVQDYSEVREDENGKYVEKRKEGEEIAGLEIDPGGEQMPGGVGGPMEMASPYKNYKNPQDYKAFNFGNKPTPFNKYKKGKY